MACFLLNRHDTLVRIPSFETRDNLTVYRILVRVGQVSWTVIHRYNDFVDLHDKLVLDHGVTKDILPPKKVLGNKDPSFIEKRRHALEQYLQIIINFLQQAMPRELALFLDFHQYDILFMLQNLALTLFLDGDALLQDSKSFAFTPLQLHAISERLKQPCPPLQLLDKRLDFSHVLDFCVQLVSVLVQGSSTLFGTSSIVPNTLPFELSAFRAVERLVLLAVPLNCIQGLGTVRDTVRALTVQGCGLRSLSQVLLCDALHQEVVAGQPCWIHVVQADFSHNELGAVGDAVTLLPSVESLDLSHNCLSQLGDLTRLPHLSRLLLGGNLLSGAVAGLRLGNVVQLDLSQNSISSLAGLSRLLSLEMLDLGSNVVRQLEEIRHVETLPCLESLILTGNPVATEVDYRVRVLERFGARAAELCLDNEKSSQKELDTVAVLQALRVAREGRTSLLHAGSPP